MLEIHKKRRKGRKKRLIRRYVPHLNLYDKSRVFHIDGPGKEPLLWINGYLAV